MKRIAIILIASLLSFEGFSNFDKGQILNVIAPSGLRMRVSPQVGKTIKIIPYGASLTVLEEDKIIEDRVEWVTGNWIKVSYDGDTGYVFDGFLSDFPAPQSMFEKNEFEMDLIYPVEAWVENRLMGTYHKPDTILLSNGKHRTVQHFTDGKFIKEDKKHMYKVELHLTNTRIMDVYQILQAMFDDKYKRNTFNTRSIFIKDENGDIDNIKIQLDDLVTIRRMSPDHIRLRILSSESGCAL